MDFCLGIAGFLETDLNQYVEIANRCGIDKLEVLFGLDSKASPQLHRDMQKSDITAARQLFDQFNVSPHAFVVPNDFTTTDKGLVYVDCTGPTLLEDLTEEFLVQFYGESYATEWDKIAYVMKGKEYGAISINRATSPEYSFYNHIDKESLGVFKSGNIVERIKIYW